MVQNNSGYSNFTQASPLSLYIPCYSISQLPRLGGILSLTCLNQNSLCLLHPPIPSSTVSASLVNDNSILPRNTFVPLLLSLYLTLVSSVWSASCHPPAKWALLIIKLSSSAGPHAAHAPGYMFSSIFHLEGCSQNLVSSVYKSPCCWVLRHGSWSWQAVT